MTDEEIRAVYASGECEIDIARRELRVRGSPVPVGGRAFEIIEVLARSAGELVTKDDLMNRIWPGAIVMENTLQVHAAAIRKALGPYRTLLKTESGRGYRLLGDWAARRHVAARPPNGLQRMRVNGESPVTNFPVTVTRLIGRSTAIARLRDLMSAYRVVTLTGPGGIGKTTLALKVARRLVGEFADGGWLVELASLSDPALVPSAVASTLKLGLGSGSVTPEAVARAVGDRKLLLVLDNCEHLIEVVATLTETFLRFCPYTTIVVTSREILRIQGECVFRVMPLDVPMIEHTQSAEIFGQGAAELFLTRAAEFGADFSSNSAYPPMIAAICRHLDGIPLAIEFAAARAATLGVEEVASGLHDRFALLTSGRRTALPRHRTLRATLDWSYQLLSEAERDMLRRLAIFAGPFSLDAACAVAVEGASNIEVADGIADLVSKSLVIRGADAVTAEFRLLETTRVYALDRLKESGAFDDVARRHAAYFLALLGNLHQERRSKPQDDYLAASRRRADEVHAALEWAFSTRGDSAIGLALTVAAVPLWFELFQMPTARGRVEQALPHAEAGSDDEMRLRIAFGHGLWYGTPDNAAVEATFTRALDIAERIGSTAGRMQALWGMWASRRGQADYPAALELARRYADAAEDAGDVGAIHLGHRILGLTHHFLGHLPAAREFAERALSQPHHFDPTLDLGYQAETPVAIGALLARILWLGGFPDQAADAAAQAVAAARNTGNLFGIFYAVVFAGLPIALWTGDLESALYRIDLLDEYAAANRRVEELRTCFARALGLREGNEGEALVASFIESRVDQVSVPPFADLAFDANIPVPLPGEEHLDRLWNTPELLRVDAALLLWHDAPGAVTAAEERLLRALEVARGQSALSWELRAAMDLAQVWQRQGRVAEAHDLLVSTYGKFTEGFGTSDLVRARSLIEALESTRPRPG
ncbi:winged helix-turn-helix domain-containing protein [Acidisphaera sp. S103]|uniref:ATP-binding protein n=1 Tax=Acidisphaera sp. S103 TaxID=1747223 RepID=UPI00131AAF39|nr:winged helix-turn-helix domain-containing protein [Acidisphaera sp. S103]